MAFRHGVETQFQAADVVSVTGIPTAVVGLVGTAPKGPVNVPTLVATDVEAAEIFGIRQTGFTIGYALDGIFDQATSDGGCLIVVINTLDLTDATNRTTVVAATYPLVGDSLLLPHKYVFNVVVKNAAATVTYVDGVDYTLEGDTGKVTRKTGGVIAANATLTINYDRPVTTGTSATDIIGGVNPTTSKRTGLNALIDTYSKYGFDPSIIIAPGYSSLVSVSAEMIIVADKLGAMALIDAPVGATRDEAIAGRGGAAPVSNFNTSSSKAILLYPNPTVFDPVTETDIIDPYSSRFAGLIGATDARFGYWWSPSNKEIKGITGFERKLYTSFTDANSDSNLLNAAGIVTYLNTFGSGFRSWGNRSSAFPTITAPENFISIERTRIIIAKSIEQASLQFIDRPINQALIDAVIATVLGYLAEQTVAGALLPGSTCLFLKADNPVTSLAKGIAIFTVGLMPPPPAEQIIYKQRLDTSLLGALARA